MGNFSSLFAEFDKALDVVQAKKDAANKAQAVLDVANKEYTDASEYAQHLRSQITEQLSGILPTSDSRVRISV